MLIYVIKLFVIVFQITTIRIYYGTKLCEHVLSWLFFLNEFDYFQLEAGNCVKANWGA